MKNSDPQNSSQHDSNKPTLPRRSFFKKVAEIFMASGLLLSYGTFLSILARYLYPSGGQKKDWLFVTELTRMKAGDSLEYLAPSGEKIAVARRALEGKVTDFIALSSTCPHLGCQVHWEGAHNRFFCPCHNGAFSAEGHAIAGPPKDAKQSLATYPLKVENGLLFIEAPLEKLNTPAQGLTYPNLPPRNTRPQTFLSGKN